MRKRRAEEIELEESHNFRKFLRRMSKHSYRNQNKNETQRVIKVTNVRVLKDHKLVDDDLWICGGVVIDPMKRFWEAHTTKEFAADEVIDGGGRIVAPGFLDLQINGGFGVDFSNPDITIQDVEYVSRKLLQHGCTSFLPTLVTSSPKVYRKVLPLMAPRKSSLEKGAAVLGAHCEGPFISEHKFGAHKKEFIAIPKKGYESIQDMYGKSNLKNKCVRFVTMAPELSGALEAGKKMHERDNIVVSAGHSMASVDLAKNAVEKGGYTMLTHLFNAMPSFHHRDPGLVGLLGCPDVRDKFYYSLIADGIHSHPYSCAIANASHPNGLILVTDAMAAMGLEDGEHQLGEMRVKVKGNRAVISGTSILAGSVSSMDMCVRKLVEMIGCSPVLALEAASLHPAQLLGIEDKKGTLKPGADGDFVMLNDKLEVMATFIGGACAWRKE